MDCEGSRFNVESIDGPCKWADRANELLGESMSAAYPGPRLAPATFLRLALCRDSGLSGLAVKGELKEGFLECCKPLMTDVWRWCRLDKRLCRLESTAILEGAVSPSGMVGCADAALDDDAAGCDVPGP